MIDKLVVCAILLAQIGILSSDCTSQKVKLSFIKDINENFASTTDSIIELEKRCAHYTDSLSFAVSFIEYPGKRDSLCISIESNTNIAAILHCNPIAFFKRNNHYFFVCDTIPPKLFLKISDPVEFSYKISETEDMEDIIVSDDSHSYWTYLFCNNEFYLLSHLTWCD